MHGRVYVSLPLDSTLKKDQLNLQLVPLSLTCCVTWVAGVCTGSTIRASNSGSGTNVLSSPNPSDPLCSHPASSSMSGFHFRGKRVFMAWKRTHLLFAFTILLLFSHLPLVLLSSLLPGRCQWLRGPRPFACWDCRFESRRGHGCLSVVNVGYCQVEVSASGWSPVQRSPTECGVSECDRGALQRRPRPTEPVEPWNKKGLPPSASWPNFSTHFSSPPTGAIFFLHFTLLDRQLTFVQCALTSSSVVNIFRKTFSQYCSNLSYWHCDTVCRYFAMCAQISGWTWTGLSWPRIGTGGGLLWMR
jgi:hypothetical protein